MNDPTAEEIHAAGEVLWYPRSGGFPVRLRDVTDLHLINIVRICNTDRQGDTNDPDAILHAAEIVAWSRSVRLEEPIIRDPFRVAQIVQDLAMALHEEGITETSQAARRAWSPYEREFKK